VPLLEEHVLAPWPGCHAGPTRACRGRMLERLELEGRGHGWVASIMGKGRAAEGRIQNQNHERGEGIRVGGVGLCVRIAMFATFATYEVFEAAGGFFL